MRRGAIIVYTGNNLLEKGRIGKIIAKEGDIVFTSRFQQDVEMAKGFYGIYYEGLESLVTFNNKPIVLIPVSDIRYAYSYEKLLRRRNIAISSYELNKIDEPLVKGSLVILNNADMGIHTVINNIRIVMKVFPEGGCSIINIVTLQIVYVSKTKFDKNYRSLNNYEIRKLNRYGKTISANR